MDLSEERIFIAGAGGMVGRAIVRKLDERSHGDIIAPTSADLDLTDQAAVESFFLTWKPSVVVLAAGKVGGILANNTFPAEFLYQNVMIASNVIHSAFTHGVRKLIYLGSSCIYPKLATQPIKEEALLAGYLEPTNEPYAVAKICGIKLCESYFRQYGSNFYSVMPPNLYGIYDNFDPERSHVIPALIRRFHDARTNGSDVVTLWGTGTPRREFIVVDDAAEAIVFLLQNIDAGAIYDKGISHINIGSGNDIQISELASMIAEIVGYTGKVAYDSSKPDGTMQKLMDVSRMSALGWTFKTSLKEGLVSTYRWFLENEALSQQASYRNL